MAQISGSTFVIGDTVKFKVGSLSITAFGKVKKFFKMVLAMIILLSMYCFELTDAFL